ncbi:putative mg2+ transporter [Phaeomoniella chlamydospora]|uniref:Putative mg2+ transporter n=1 Tax=Phaeomoniella chlamydospora TaxID=158046 RepID=A0A0G2F2V8_PHACM|nr:putative mg2+ transporter [Phaeomoniella chlamydospora]
MFKTPESIKPHLQGFQTCKDVVEETIGHDSRDYPAVKNCLDDVKRLHEKKFKKGKFIDAVAHQWPESPTASWDGESTASARFVCFPIFALYPTSDQEGETDPSREDHHPPRAMAQYFYNLEDTQTRDGHQTIRKLFGKGTEDSRCNIIHVFHLWAMTVGDSYTITAAPVNADVLLGHNINLISYDLLHIQQGRSIKYTDREKTQYFFPLNDCKKWKHLIKKIGDLKRKGDDAETIQNPNAEFVLVDGTKRIIDQDKWAEIAAEESTKLVVIQLIHKTDVHFDEEAVDELEPCLDQEEQERMQAFTSNMWRAKWNDVRLRTTLEDLRRRAEEESDEHVAPLLREQIEHARRASLVASKQHLGAKFLAAANTYKAKYLKGSDDALSLSSRDPQLDPTTMSLQEMAGIPHSYTPSLPTRNNYEYRPRSNLPVSRSYQYRHLPETHNVPRDTSFRNPLSSPLGIIHPDMSMQGPSVQNPFIQRHAGTEAEQLHIHTPMAPRSLSNSTARYQGSLSERNVTPEQINGHVISPVQAYPTINQPSRQSSSAVPPRSDSPLQRYRSKPSQQEQKSPLQFQDTKKDPVQVTDVKKGVNLRRSRTPLFTNLDKYRPILEWPVDGVKKLPEILEVLHTQLEISNGEDVEEEISQTYRSIKESNREECFKYVNSLDGGQTPRKPGAVKIKRTLVTTAEDLLNFYVPDHYTAPIVKKYWGIVKRLCEMTPHLMLVEDDCFYTGIPPTQKHSVVAYISGEFWKLHQRVTEIVKGVHSNETRPYWLPQHLSQSFRAFIEFLAVAIKDTRRERLQEAVDKVLDLLQDAERDLPNVVDESEENIWNRAGYEHVDAHELLALLLENGIKICLHDLNSEHYKQHDPACFDIIDIYSRYVSTLHTQARDDANLKVYDHIKLVSEEIGIIKQVLGIQWQVAAAFDAMTSEDSSTLKTRVKDRIFDRLLQSMGDFDELHNKVGNARIEATQAIQMKQDLNNKAILIFTSVSTVFLPLSFVAALLSMNLKDTSRMNQGQWLFWAIAVPLTVAIMIGALSFAYYDSLYPVAKRSNYFPSESNAVKGFEAYAP